MPRRKKGQEHAKKVDYFHFYPALFFTDTATWSDAEVGYYTRLLCHNWMEKVISDDPHRLAMLPGNINLKAIPDQRSADVPTGTPKSTLVVQNADVSGTQIHASHSQDRMVMWEMIKKKFEKKDGGLVNPRLEKERYETEQYYLRQRLRSEKGVAAMKKKRQKMKQEEEQRRLAEIDAKNNVPTGTTYGLTYEVPNKINTSISSLKEGLEEEKGLREKQVPVGTPLGTSTDKYTSILPPAVRSFYHMTFEQLQSLGDNKNVDTVTFDRWKTLVRFVVDNNFSDLFQAKFLFPKDLPEMERKGFRMERWQEVLAKICSVGVEPKHNLYHRIQDAVQNWLKPKGTIAEKPAMQTSIDPKLQQRYAEMAQQQRQSLAQMLVNKKITQKQHDWILPRLAPDKTIPGLVKESQKPENRGS